MLLRGMMFVFLMMPSVMVLCATIILSRLRCRLMLMELMMLMPWMITICT